MPTFMLTNVIHGTAYRYTITTTSHLFKHDIYFRYDVAVFETEDPSNLALHVSPVLPPLNHIVNRREGLETH